jgi:WD40 repeat protein
MNIPILAASPDGRYKVSHRRVETGGRLRLDSETVCLFEDGRDPRLLQPLLNWAVICAALSKDGVLALGLEPFPELYPYVDRLDETIAILDIRGDGEFTLIEREVEQRHAPSVRALAFSDDGTLLVAGGKHGVTV